MEKYTLISDCNFEDVWEHNAPAPDALSSEDRPVKEVGYVRGDHDGHRWWTKFFISRSELITDEIRGEINRLAADILETEPISKGIPGIRKFCAEHPDPLQDGSAKRCSYFYEGAAANYWIEFLDRPKDYNLYIHVYVK